ncbi:MAG: hypothetical protein J5927_05545 [Oscillospiraceae bacterium]|nr:hypothetical protein [Oscillospiraceae bacterium]
MLGKLLKHEFRATGRVMLPVMGAMVLLAALANVSIRFMLRGVEAGTALQILGGLLIAFAVLAVIATAVMAVVLMVSRFYRNLLKDEGYLMMTLPVSVHGLIWSKLIVSLVWILAVTLLIWVVGLLTALNAFDTNLAVFIEGFPSWAEIRQVIAELGIGSRLTTLGIQFFLAALLGALVTCLHFYAAMSLGHMFSKDKVLLSIVFFVALSFAFSLMGVSAGMVLPMMGSGAIEAMETMEGLPDTLGFFSRILWQGLATSAVQGAILYLATTLSLKRGLNLG